MKRSIAQLGYIAGVLERRGQIKDLDTADRGLVLLIANPDTRDHVNDILKGRLTYRRDWKRQRAPCIYISSSQAIGWFMTLLGLGVSSAYLRDRMIHAVLQWKSRAPYGRKPRPAPCHPDRPYHAKNKCQMCYKREVRGTLYVNVKVR